MSIVELNNTKVALDLTKIVGMEKWVLSDNERIRGNE